MNCAKRTAHKSWLSRPSFGSVTALAIMPIRSLEISVQSIARYWILPIRADINSECSNRLRRRCRMPSARRATLAISLLRPTIAWR